MTDRDERQASSPPSKYRADRPTTVWLAVIPMILISLIGLAGGHLLSGGDQAGAATGPRSPDDTTPVDSTPVVQMAREDAIIERVTDTTPAVASGTSPTAHAGPTAIRRSGVTASPRPSASGPSAPGPSASGCAAAEAWIATHAAPGFRVLCPADALGHQAMTCADVAGLCPGQRIITIADPCPAAYMNEAHNSWIVTGLARGRLDPYGSCN